MKEFINKIKKALDLHVLSTTSKSIDTATKVDQVTKMLEEVRGKNHAYLEEKITKGKKD